MSKITVVIDNTDDALKDNNIFDPIFATKISHTILPLCYLVKEAKKQEIQFVTSDIFLRNPEAYNKSTYLISHLTSKRTHDLITKGAIPLVVTCQESPFIATRFYFGLRTLTANFKYSILFKGMKAQTSHKTVFKIMYFPQFYEPRLVPPITFKEKKPMIMISGNKGMGLVKVIIKSIIIKTLYGFKARYIYKERENTIDHFSKFEGFDLYGRDWDKSNKISVKRSYRGIVDNKQEIMKKYRFALCLENSMFKGYVTEKIFDAFFAGCVPIYLGAPDIHDFVPRETFIDMRDYKTLSDLQKYIESMTPEKYNEYLNEIDIFLKSDRFKPFSHIEYAKNIISLIKNENEQA